MSRNAKEIGLNKSDEGRSKIPGNKVAILGLGVSGYQSALFLKEKGFDLWVSDNQVSEMLRQRAGVLEQNGIPVEIGSHNHKKILQSDWILISPGISPASEIYRAVSEKRVPILSEIEVASWFCPTERIIAVTGTCGKTTVTTLISQVLARAGLRVHCGGNIGNPWIGELQKISTEDVVVLELSSFQLQHCRYFKPHVGILLNISSNHEDWHKDIREYAAAKIKLFENQTSTDYAIINGQDQKRYFPEARFLSRVIYFDQEMKKTGSANPNESVIRLATSLFGCESKIVEDVLSGFHGIAHRLELFHSSKGVQYVNDSKSTTLASLKWALNKYPNKRVVLIAGGHPKSRSFEDAKDLIAQKVKKLILIGEARDLLREQWKGASPIFETDDFKEAIAEACRFAETGDVVLLSPACASFDMFKNYEDRGNQFKILVSEMTGAGTTVYHPAKE
ncbi:MAG: UDP-N-acetylmuramoyl-L-alanine--D-glutamate ligase [Candidatus Omnitrophica bacterium]|nr:UDP-N-acetylmuramoyl-L-alanine--D-glutamate ligase [Candidatus Omnitrophota bacterium]MDD5670434.1 UDP-N-acetylmuramoyl-L-alanine--D-glutamate ligase [Candidatus Omnitrophota bacterium]